jgi:integrase
VDLAKRRIAIPRSTAKTDASARVVELNRDALTAAERLLLRARVLGASAAGHFLMPKNLSRISHGDHKGERGYDPNQHQKCWDTAWSSLTKEGGLDPLRFHDMRHTFITHMVERGVPLGVIQAIVGHISAKMLRHYLHLSSGVSRRAVELFDKDPIFAEESGLAGQENKQISDSIIN